MTNDENIIELDFSEEMKESYRDYAVSVIVERALPDVRDGLKPVQRRIMYAMNELNLSPDKPHRKSARIVGDTMGKYHPHGDTSIYDALVHLTKDYLLNAPLVDGHGNFGSIDGDGAAAMRYTEARLSPIAESLLENLDKNTVEFIPNFDDSEKEPVVLPAQIPNLLINGTTGIAVGMATNIAPHNPAEVIDAVIACMDRPAITISKLMDIVKGPDFPTGGIIVNGSDLPEIYEKGEGKIRVRAKTVLEKGEYGRTNIVITEIPYTVSGNKTRLVESLAKLIKDKVYDEIFDVRDETSKEGIRIVIEVKKGRDVENLLNGLYKKTQMEDTYSLNLLAISDRAPKVFNLKSMIEEFILFQEEIYTKEYKYYLEKATKRLEVTEGLIKATDVIDLIIEILRGSTSVKQARACLTEGITEGIKFKSKASEKQAATLLFTPTQTDAILTMQLSKLIGLEIVKLHEEYDKLVADIKEYNEILGDKSKLYSVIKKRLRKYKKILGCERRTQIDDIESKAYVEEVKEEDLYVFIDRFGYVKSMDSSSYQRLDEVALAEYRHILCVKNTDRLCVFTKEGMLYYIKTEKIPAGKQKDRGTLVNALTGMSNTDEAICFVSFEQLYDSMVFFATKKGYVKFVSGVEFESDRLKISSTKMGDGDELAAVQIMSAGDYLAENSQVVMITKDHMTISYGKEEVSEYKRASRGVTGMKLGEGDEVEFARVIGEETKEIEYNNKNVRVKRIPILRRAGKGKKIKL